MKRLVFGVLLAATTAYAVAQDPAAMYSNSSGASTNYNPAFSRASSLGDMTAPTGQLKPLIATLEQRASAGDISAAKELFAGLSQCQGESLMANKGVFNQNCEGITDGDYASMGKWLTQAAQSGDSQAQYAYATVGIDYVLGVQEAESNPAAFFAYKAEAKGYLLGLAAKCNIDATYAIASDAAGFGLLFGDDLNDGYKFAVITDKIQNHHDKDNNASIAMGRIKEQIAKKIHNPLALDSDEKSADTFVNQYCK